MEKGTVILKRTLKSKKFNVTFPKDTLLNYFKDSVGYYYANHPTSENLCICFTEKNIKQINKL
jgi:hypothetical protein